MLSRPSLAWAFAQRQRRPRKHATQRYLGVLLSTLAPRPLSSAVARQSPAPPPPPTDRPALAPALFSRSRQHPIPRYQPPNSADSADFPPPLAPRSWRARRSACRP